MSIPISGGSREIAFSVFLFKYNDETAWAIADMNTLLLLIALTCQPGDRLLDLGGKLPSDLQSMDLIISVEPFYARIYIYEAGSPDNFQQCCSNKRTSVLKLPIGSGRYCVRQSQPRMTWKIRGLIKGGIDL